MINENEVMDKIRAIEPNIIVCNKLPKQGEINTIYLIPCTFKRLKNATEFTADDFRPIIKPEVDIAEGYDNWIWTEHGYVYMDTVLSIE